LSTTFEKKKNDRLHLKHRSAEFITEMSSFRLALAFTNEAEQYDSQWQA